MEFFSDKVVLVEPKGFQGIAYTAMNNMQKFISAKYTFDSVSILKSTGNTGLGIITGAPLTFVGVTYLGSFVLGYFGSVAGSNIVGSTLNCASYILSRPMKGVEVVVNGLILKPLSRTIGLPLILNGTEQVLHGKGISIEEWTQIGTSYQRITNSQLI
jgi:hypothetical protein